MNFNSIPGHEKIKEELLSMTDNNRLPHALLFTGPKGNGKLALALAITSYVQCRSKNGTDICGICPSCKKTNKLAHPDINFIIPNIASEQKQLSTQELMAEWRKLTLENPYIEIEDWLEKLDSGTKMANINKESINSVIDYFNYTLFEGERKIVIIWNAELLGGEGNRLLKLIEEPPQNSLIILVAEDTSKILKTILSRCQIIRIPPFSDDDLEKWIYDKAGEDSSLIRQMISLAEGDINKLIKLMKVEQTDLFEFLLNWLNVSYLGISEKILQFSEEFARMGKETQKQFFLYTLRFLEQVLKSYYLKTDKIRLNERELNSMEKLKTMLGSEKLIILAEEINKNIYHIERNANPKLLIFESSFKLNRILRN
jgi:DNA polymerase-3 subunit delta'